MFAVISPILFALIPSSVSLFFGGGGGGSCGCNCPQVPICPPAPVCSPISSCSNSAQYYQPASPNYQPGWIPAIPASPSASSLYSTSYSSAPAPLLIPSSPSYLSAIPPASYSVAPPILPAPISPSSAYYGQSFSPGNPTSSSESFSLPYLRSGYAAPTNTYTKQYVHDSSQESEAPSESAILPPPPPPPPPTDEEYATRVEPQTPQTFIYSTSEMVQPSVGYKAEYTPALEYMREGNENSEGLVEKQGYWPTESTPYNKFDQFEKRHNVLKRMKTVKSKLGESILRTNNTCNSIKLANVMTRVIVEDVTISKRMIQHATKLAFDGAKFDVFCATGEFSYSIHSRKYCEVTKDDITCFAFR